VAVSEKALEPAAKKWTYWGLGFALVSFALIAYLPSFKASFQYDDFAAVVNNPYIKINDLRPGSLFKAAFQTRLQNRPLTSLSLALNYYFNGLDTFGYHLLNFFFLVWTGLGVWLLLKKLLMRLGYDQTRSGLAAWLAALVWTVNPVNTQAVTYIVQRHTSIAGAFSIWSLYLYHIGRESRTRPRIFFAFSGLLCFFALLSKETAATLPAIILAYKIYFFDQLKPGWLKSNWKGIAGLAVFYVGAGLVLLRPGMVQQLADTFKSYQYDPWQRFLTEPGVLLWYPLIIAFPFPQFLSLLHAFPSPASWINQATTALAFLAIIAIIFLAVRKARKWRALSFAALWYFGNLLVEALPLPIAAAHEHRLYLASLALIAPAAAWPVLKLKKSAPAVAWALVVAMFFGFFTYRRNLVWRDEAGLWRDTSSKAPTYLWSWYHYCMAVAQTGNCRSVIMPCALAAEAAPDDYKPHHNLGVCYLRMGKTELAERELRKAAELNPDSVITYFDLALLYSIRKDYQEAVKWYLVTIARDSSNPKPHFYLALTYQDMGQADDRIRELREALRLKPDWSDARLELAAALSEQGSCSEAMDLIKASASSDPGFEEIFRRCHGGAK